MWKHSNIIVTDINDVDQEVDVYFSTHDEGGNSPGSILVCRIIDPLTNTKVDIAKGQIDRIYGEIAQRRENNDPGEWFETINHLSFKKSIPTQERINKVTNKQGWDIATRLFLAEKYIRESGNFDDFADMLEKHAEDENLYQPGADTLEGMW
jgi:pterin-4a-carbinolamine dehydratase